MLSVKWWQAPSRGCLPERDYFCRVGCFNSQRLWRNERWYWPRSDQELRPACFNGHRLIRLALFCEANHPCLAASHIKLTQRLILEPHKDGEGLCANRPRAFRADTFCEGPRRNVRSSQGRVPVHEQLGKRRILQKLQGHIANVQRSSYHWWLVDNSFQRR